MNAKEILEQAVREDVSDIFIVADFLFHAEKTAISFKHRKKNSSRKKLKHY